LRFAYNIVVDTSGEMTCIVNNWQDASTPIINSWVPMHKLPSATLPAGYRCRIALRNDVEDRITQATYTVSVLNVAPASGTILHGYWGSDTSQHVHFIGVDGHVHELYNAPSVSWANVDLTKVDLASITQTLTMMSDVSVRELSPIVAFELDIVGFDNGQSTTMSTGSGTITYEAEGLLTVVNTEPACCEFVGGTAETANTVYGQLPTGSAAKFVQTFNKSSTTIKAPKHNRIVLTRPKQHHTRSLST
jgi:hypothetical protein